MTIEEFIRYVSENEISLDAEIQVELDNRIPLEVSVSWHDKKRVVFYDTGDS